MQPLGLADVNKLNDWTFLSLYIVRLLSGCYTINVAYRLKRDNHLLYFYKIKKSNKTDSDLVIRGHFLRIT